MKLGIALAAAGFAGTLLFLAGTAIVSTWDLYVENPWILAAGGVCFIIFVIGMHRFRKELKKRREAERRRLPPPQP
jgi:energy-converting hydrogenase Eha subunit B